MNLENLNKNLKNTNWSNARIENDKVLADHNGKLLFSVNGGQQKYEGVTTCEIRPNKCLYDSVKDYDFDQNGWVNSNLDFCPIDQEFNY